MSDLVILSKEYRKALEANKVQFPVSLTEKYDGMCIRADVSPVGYVSLFSRQGTLITSLEHLKPQLINIAKLISTSENVTLIGEAYEQGKPFEYIAGRVKNKSVQYPECTIRLFDLTYYSASDYDYVDRISLLYHAFSKSTDHLDCRLVSARHQSSGMIICKTPEEVEETYKLFMTAYPDAEGMVIRPLRGEVSKYRKGRSYGFLKLVPAPSVDLVIESIQEGTGEAVGRLGSFLCTFNSTIVNVSAGRLTAEERKTVWENRESYIGKCIQVRFKTITKSGSLREPRFDRWRTDKDNS